MAISELMRFKLSLKPPACLRAVVRLELASAEEGRSVREVDILTGTDPTP